MDKNPTSIVQERKNASSSRLILPQPTHSSIVTQTPQRTQASTPLSTLKYCTTQPQANTPASPRQLATSTNTRRLKGFGNKAHMMISTIQRMLLAALATVLILDPTRAFFVSPPAASAASAAARWQSRSSLGLDSGLVRASAREQGGLRGVGAPLSMAVEQKGRVTVYHKETCPYCKKVRITS